MGTLNQVQSRFYPKFASDFEALMYMIAYYGAATLAGAKPASLIHLKADMSGVPYLATWDTYKERIRRHFPLTFVELGRNEKGVQILFYRPDMLGTYLSQQECVTFLNRFGYLAEWSLSERLNHLKSRFGFHCPHEIGLFLGYPLGDVEAFITCPDKKCLKVGYWKVFNDLDGAEATFKLYDQLRDNVLTCIHRGVRPSHLIFKNHDLMQVS